jgi:hypothetical protein
MNGEIRMMNQQEAKARARILKTFLAEQGVNLSHGLMLEAVARMERHKNWATFLAAESADKAYLKTEAEVANWPIRVFTFDNDEEFRVLPAGVTLADASRYDTWRLFDNTGTVPVPEVFKFNSDVVVQAIRAETPATDEYGIPDFADEDYANKALREDFNLGAIAELDITLHDRGDDGATVAWFEARVSPAMARLLPAAEEQPATPATLTAQAWQAAFDEVFEDAGGFDIEIVMNALNGAAQIPHLCTRSAEQYLRNFFGSERIVVKARCIAMTSAEVVSHIRSQFKVNHERIMEDRKG